MCGHPVRDRLTKEFNGRNEETHIQYIYMYSSQQEQ